MRFGFDPKVWFDGIVDTVQEVEELGYTSVWASEHLVTEQDTFWPAPLTRLAGMATVTEDIELYTSIIILPLHNLLDVAVEAAVVDRMSNGRLNVGVALGYVPEEFEAYGVPLENRAGRLVEGLHVLDLFLSSKEPISYDGQYVSFEDLKPHPVSAQDPRPTLLVGGWGDKAMERSIGLADGWIPGPTGDIEALKQRQQQLQEICDDLDRDWDEIHKPIARDIVISESSSDAWDHAEDALYQGYADEYGSEEWNHPVIDQETVRDFETLAEDRFFIGTPEEIIEEINRTNEELEIDELKLRFHHTSRENLKEQYRLFADEVMPSF